MAAKRSYEVGQGSDPGRKRTENEDRLDIFEPHDQGQMAQKGALYIVADGMGGHEAGAVASDRAVRKIIDEYYYGAAPSLGVPESLTHAIRVANTETFRLATEHPDWSGMGTTIVAAVVRGEELQIANVGDSRAMLFRPGEEPRQLSVDHTFVGEQVRQGAMTLEEAQRSPRRHQITRSLGRRPEIEVELAPPLNILPGDTVVLCSDGLSDMLSPKEMEAVVKSPAQEAAKQLIAQANARGGIDNITVIVLKWPGAATPAAEAMPELAQRSALPPWILPAGGVVAVGLILLAILKLSGGKGPAKPQTPTARAPTVTLMSSTAEVLLPTSTARPPLGPTSTLVPSETPVPATATPTRPPPTATSKLYPAPQLLIPMQGAKLSVPPIRLAWQWEHLLKTDEWFDLWVWPQGDAERAYTILKERLTDIIPPGGVGVYLWKVRIVRGKPGNVTDFLSPWSDVRSFDYTGPSATPVPPVVTVVPPTVPPTAPPATVQPTKPPPTVQPVTTPT